MIHNVLINLVPQYTRTLGVDFEARKKKRGSPPNTTTMTTTPEPLLPRLAPAKWKVIGAYRAASKRLIPTSMGPVCRDISRFQGGYKAIE